MRLACGKHGRICGRPGFLWVALFDSSPIFRAGSLLHDRLLALRPAATFAPPRGTEILSALALVRKPGVIFVAVFLLVTREAWQTLGSPAERLEKHSSSTFYKDVLPILQNKCQSCHRTGEAAPMALVTYEQARPLAGKIAAAVELSLIHI